MPTEFDKLCSELNINPNDVSEGGIASLKQWCLDHISQDDYVRDDAQYLDLTRDYLDVFLPNSTKYSGNPVTEFNQMNVIQYAAYKGYDRFLQSTPTLKNVINSKTNVGMTPLHLAAARGHVHAVEVLLASGARPTELNNKNEYPIKSALYTPVSIDPDFKTRKEIIFNLLKDCAPDTVKGVDDRGNTLAHAMALHGYNELMSELIREKQPIVVEPNNFGNSPIHTAILNAQAGIVQQLLPLPGVLDRDKKGKRILHYAAEYGTPEIIQDCCNAYPKSDMRDSRRKTPLMYAAEAGNLPAVIALCERGANVNLIDYKGFSILHYAVTSRNVQVVSWLLDHTAVDVNAIDVEGKSALSYADIQGSIRMQEISELLNKKSSKCVNKVRYKPGM